MLDGILKKLFGDKNQKDLNELAPIVDSTNEQYVKLRDISDDQLREKNG
jgi:preprotein translocase subunit SecA